VDAPELRDLLEALARAEKQRATALTDLSASEKLQAAEDLRLGLHEAAAEAEWRACETGAREVEEHLRQADKEKHEAATALDRQGRETAAAAGGANPATRDMQRRAAAERLAHHEKQYAALRERAAALRASTIGARTKLDQAVSARRQAAAAMAAGITGQTRQRAEAERQIRELSTQIGSAAFEARLPVAALLPGYERVERLEQTVLENDRHIGVVTRAAGAYDHRKLATGVGLLTGLLGALGVALWALLR
jgi:hypothetical protein